MLGIRGTPVNINGRTGGTPGPVPSNAGNASLRVAIPVPPGRNATTSTFARYLRIANVDATTDMKVSFLDSTQMTIPKGTEKEFSGEIPFFVLQSAGAATVQWEATVIVAA